MIAPVTNALGEAYRYREVLYNLLARDLKLRYKHTALGYLWSLLNPILQLTVLSFVFSHVVRREMHDYTMYLFSGLLVWSFFQTSILTSAQVFLENENFIKKIYLPKLLFPLSKTLFRGVDFLFSVVALGLLGTVLGFRFPPTMWLLPVAMGLLFCFALGWGIVVAVTNVFFRDFQYLLNIGLQLLYFATPLIYPISAIPEPYQMWLRLSPLYSQVLLFHRIIYDGIFPSGLEWFTAIAVSLGSLAFGVGLLLLREDELVFRM